MHYNRGVFMFATGSVAAYEAGRSLIEGAHGFSIGVFLAISCVAFVYSWPIICRKQETAHGEFNLAWFLMGIGWLIAGCSVARRFVTGAEISAWADLLFVGAAFGFMLLALCLCDNEELAYDEIKEGNDK